jgi:hypothetical protein
LSGVIGFVSSQQRLNVAMTRARFCLAIVGDFSTFVRNPLFERLFRHANQSGCLWKGHEFADLKDFVSLQKLQTLALTKQIQKQSAVVAPPHGPELHNMSRSEPNAKISVVNHTKVTTQLVSDTLVTRIVKRTPSDDANAAFASEELDKVETSVGFQSSVLEDLPFQLQISSQVQETILKMTVASQRQHLINILLKLGRGHFDKENLRRTWAEQQNQSISGLALEDSQRISGILQVAGS